MEGDKKVMPGDDFARFCSSSESGQCDHRKPKRVDCRSLFVIALAFLALLSMAAAIYLGVAHRDCFLGNDSPQSVEDGQPINEADAAPNAPSQIDFDDNEYKSVDTLTELGRISLKFVSNCNCSLVRDLLARLQEPIENDFSGSRSEERFELREYLLGRASELNCELDYELIELGFSKLRRRAARGLPCRESSVGDGWCDRSCNNEEYEYDYGDCCQQSCVARPREFPCGINGYDCKVPPPGFIVPSWFTNQAQLCYRWYPDGDGGQCGGGASRLLCANVNQYTGYYRDDTDGRPGGCRMSWSITAPGADAWFNQVQFCYTWYADGNGGQCGGGAPSELCAPVNSYTSYYRDDTDGRPGGCRMSWQIRVPDGAPSWIYTVKVCYQWYPDGDGGQCGGGAGRILCASPGQWTPYYRDDTDGRGGGCRMKWGLFVD